MTVESKPLDEQVVRRPTPASPRQRSGEQEADGRHATHDRVVRCASPYWDETTGV